MNDTLTAVSGVRVGHSTDMETMTGLTVVLPPEGSVASISVRGPAPGTREMGPLVPGNTVDRVDAILLTGGSAFGLDAAAGVMQYLAARERGVCVDGHVIPIVPAAVLFDLAVGEPRAPTPDDARLACSGAHAEPVRQGSVGAGTGCTVGKLRGAEWCMRGGLGSAALSLPGGVTVAALAAVNAVGDVVDEDGAILAGVRGEDGFPASEELMLRQSDNLTGGGTNTTLVVVATDARLDKTACRRLADWAHDGLARSVRPCHTSMDGDVVFALSTRRTPGGADPVGVAAVRAVAAAVRRGVCAAEGARGIAAHRDLPAGH